MEKHDPTALEATFAALDDNYDRRSQAELIKPPINYMGTKFGQLDFILPLLPWHEIYVEVFGGSGAILLNKNPSKLEIFNDRYAGSVALYKCLQSDELLKKLVEKISIMPHAREFFTWCQKTWEQETDDLERAARWYYTIQASFAGRGDAWGRVKNGNNNIPNKIAMGLSLFPAIHERLRKVQLECLDWRQCFKDFDSSSTLFYCDPPYYGNDVYSTGFTKKDHIELCERIFQLQGAVVLSGFENPIYDNFPWDSIHINDNVDNRCNGMSYDYSIGMEGREGTVNREPRTEFLWIKEVS